MTAVVAKFSSSKDDIRYLYVKSRLKLLEPSSWKMDKKLPPSKIHQELYFWLAMYARDHKDTDTFTQESLLKRLKEEKDESKRVSSDEKLNVSTKEVATESMMLLPVIIDKFEEFMNYALDERWIVREDADLMKSTTVTISTKPTNG